MKLLGFAIPLLWVAPFIWGIALCLRARRRPEPVRLGRALAMGVGWQALWTVPVLVLQALFMAEGLMTRLAFLYVPWLVHCGGATVTRVFEDTAKDVTGHRRDTLLDNFHYFAALTVVQMLAVAAVFAWRYRRTESLKDPGILALGVAVLANGLLNIRWTWWGT